MFNFGKKKEKNPTCCCGGSETTCCEPAPAKCCCEGECTIRSIKVLGSGCKSCHALLENSQAAVKALGMELAVEYVTDMEKIMAYGVMQMPALVVNEQVVSMGKVLKPEDVQVLLKARC